MSSRYVGSNKGSSTVGANFDAVATTITLATGEGTRFPSPTSGDYTLLTLQNTSGVREIVCCVGRTADVMTVGIPGSAAANVAGRNYEAIYGMAAAAWAIGDVVSCRPTASIGMGDHIIPAGTKMLFMQTAAPVGWTKSTTHNDKALRVVSGAASSGGTTAFSSVFTSKTPTGTVGGTAISEAQLPSHAHTGTTASDGSHAHGVTDPGHAHEMASGVSAGSTGWVPYVVGSNVLYSSIASNSVVTGISIVAGGAHTHTFTSSAVGSGSTHTHSLTGGAMDFAVQYADVIVATRD